LLGGLQEIPPGGDVGPPTQERAALPLGHAAPDAELDAVVQRIGQAFGPDRASATDELCPVLGGTLHKKRVRIRTSTGGTGGPIRDPHFDPTPLRWSVVLSADGRGRRASLFSCRRGERTQPDVRADSPRLDQFPVWSSTDTWPGMTSHPLRVSGL